MLFSNKFFLALLVVTLGVWGNAIFQIIRTLGGSSKEKIEMTQKPGSLGALDLSLLNRKAFIIDTSLTDPFQSFLYAKRPVVKSSGKKEVSPKPKPPKKEVKPPTAKINGILWGPNPVAILEKGGKTEVVKKGAEVWGFKVLKVEKTKVVVQKEGVEFVISQ